MTPVTLRYAPRDGAEPLLHKESDDVTFVTLFGKEVEGADRIAGIPRGEESPPTVYVFACHKRHNVTIQYPCGFSGATERHILVTSVTWSSFRASAVASGW